MLDPRAGSGIVGIIAGGFVDLHLAVRTSADLAAEPVFVTRRFLYTQ